MDGNTHTFKRGRKGRERNGIEGRSRRSPIKENCLEGFLLAFVYFTEPAKDTVDNINPALPTMGNRP